MKKSTPFKSTKKMPGRTVAAPTLDEINRLAALYNQRQHVEAETSARDFIQRFPKHGFGWKVLGAVLQSVGKIDESLEAKQTSADLSPNDAEAWSNLGNAYQEQNRLDEAEKCLTQAIKISPNLAVAHNNLGITLEKLKRLNDAEIHYQKALLQRPDYAEAHYNYAITLQKLKRFTDAETHYRQAILIDPNHAKAHSNFAIVLKNNSQFIESEQHFLTALQLDPQFIDAHYNFALLLMLLGRLKEGWAQYQWFYHPQNTNPSKPNHPNLTAKQWNGEPLQGKTILIHSEQGFGDLIQFVRYAEHLKAHGATVWVLVTTPLVELFKTVPWVDRVLDNGEQHQTVYDFWVFPLALPFWFQTTLETVPLNVPYLSADETKVTWWREWLTQHIPAENKRVGLVWAGNPVHANDANRSIDFAELAAFENAKNVTFVSLQLGEKAQKELENCPEGVTILDAAPFIHDFTDTAALLNALDLLITVDSAPAHLSGALNLPVWTLVTNIPDWRWLLERNDSIWYKSMRLFRQPEIGDWASVLTDVKVALEQL
ncbi:MAG: tetratricopeptide repeat protein [Methylococcales bacterium]|nr:tetratricopeptide repeat protein [Methylococcales bacterium]MDD5754533.1 tetratricopeptide repeat protein [Methylococcales bacterium]